jgi:photosystem II stability/assembly factor-like uncharacterized protein
MLHYNGTNWEQVTSPTQNNLIAAKMINANNGWAVGEQGTILHYDGNQWQVFSMPQSVRINAINVIDENTVWFGGNKGFIYIYQSGKFTTNTMLSEQGYEWMNIHTMEVNEDKTGWLFGSQGTCLAIKEDKISFCGSNSPQGNDIYATHFLNADLGLAIGQNTYYGEKSGLLAYQYTSEGWLVMHGPPLTPTAVSTLRP